MQPQDESSWKTEAIAFSRYLIGEEPDEQSVALYIAAQKKFDMAISAREASKLKFTLRFPGTLGMIDGALALVNPEHVLRKKLYIMFSILESGPKYHAYFLPQKHGSSHIIFILLTGLRASFNTLFGFILLPWI
jgi:hypothetical protein